MRLSGGVGTLSNFHKVNVDNMYDDEKNIRPGAHAGAEDIANQKRYIRPSSSMAGPEESSTGARRWGCFCGSTLRDFLIVKTGAILINPETRRWLSKEVLIVVRKGSSDSVARGICKKKKSARQN
jgi:hypothetical protein